MLIAMGNIVDSIFDIIEYTIVLVYEYEHVHMGYELRLLWFIMPVFPWELMVILRCPFY